MARRKRRTSLTRFARELRANSSDAERLLWWQLRDRRFEGVKFRRQYPVGNYIVDFACLEAWLILELDGGQHSEQVRYDKVRTAFLEAQGYRVIRFWNNDVMDELEGVLMLIGRELKNRPLTLALSPALRAGERG